MLNPQSNNLEIESLKKFLLDSQELRWNTNGSFSQQKSQVRPEGQNKGMRNHSNNKIQQQQLNSLRVEEANEKTQYVGYQLPNILCTRGNQIQHNQPLCLVCTDQNCLNSNEFLLCDICSQQEHKEHQQIPLKVMIQDVLYSLNNQQQQSKPVENKLIIFKIEALKQLTDLRSVFSERLEQIEQEILYAYEVLAQSQVKTSSVSQNQAIYSKVDNLMRCTKEEELREEFQAIMSNTPALIEGNYLSDISNVTQEIDFRHEKILSILNKLSKETQQVLIQNEKQLSSIVYTCGEIISSSTSNPVENFQISAENQELQRDTIYNPLYKSNSYNKEGIPLKLSNELRENGNTSKEKCLIERKNTPDRSEMLQASKSLIETSPIPVQRFEFSKTLKDPNIQIQNRTIINGTYDSQDKFHYRVQLLQPELEQVTPTIKQWSFKITRQFPNWMAFGVCHINEMKARKFKFSAHEFNVSQLEKANMQSNHGCYLLTTHGWSFAHERSPIKTNVKFKINEVITCRFDPFKKLILFYQNNNFQSPINIIEFNSICWNKMYPCVVFWFPDDSVELL